MYTIDDSKSAISNAADQYSIPKGLFAAIAYKESGFNPYALGDNGQSYGIFQLYTGGGVGNWCAVSYDELYNPATNADCAGRYAAQRYQATQSWYEAFGAWTTRDMAWELSQQADWQAEWESAPGGSPPDGSTDYTLAESGAGVLVALGLILWVILR